LSDAHVSAGSETPLSQQSEHSPRRDHETRNLRGPRTWDQTGMPTAPDSDGVIEERIFVDKGARPAVFTSGYTSLQRTRKGAATDRATKVSA
jgi:hypothetical protein